MGAFENQCSEMSKQDLIEMLGKAFDQQRQAMEALEYLVACIKADVLHFLSLPGKEPHLLACVKNLLEEPLKEAEAVLNSR